MTRPRKRHGDPRRRADAIAGLSAPRCSRGWSRRVASPVAAFHAAFADVDGATFEVANSFLNPVLVITVRAGGRSVESRISDHDARRGAERHETLARAARASWDRQAP